MSIKEDEKFREMIESSKRYKEEIIAKQIKKAEAAMKKSMQYREKSKRYREKAQKNDQIADNLERMAIEEEQIGFLYLMQEKQFIDAILPVIKRNIDKNSIYRLCLGFPTNEEKDIYPMYDSKQIKDIVSVYYQKEKENVRKLIIIYDSVWHENFAKNRPLNYTLQVSYKVIDKGLTKFVNLSQIPEKQMSFEYILQ